MPIFRNGTVLRVTLPRYVARALGVGAGSYLTFRQNDRGELVVAKLDMEKLKNEYLQGGSAQLSFDTRATLTNDD